MRAEALKKIEKWDWLLIVGLTMAPMTGLRVWKVGPAELLCMIWSLRFFPKRLLQESDTLRFFAVFLTAMWAGTLIGLLKTPRETHILGYLVWIYLAFIAVSVYEGLLQKTPEYNKRLLFTFAELAVLWYIFLYLYSITVSKRFLGAPLWYSGVRFTGGAKNPHQIACLVCGLFFLFLYRGFETGRWTRNLLGAFGCLFILIQTDSSTGFAAVTVGFIIFLFLRPGEQFPKKRSVILVAEMLAVGIILLLGYRWFYESIMDWISSDANGMGRLNIFSTIGMAFLKSPIFGLGPGTHGRDGVIEFHNTYLEILSASGIVGFAAFIRYTVRIIQKCFASAMLLPAVAAMYAYGMGGFAMRRLVYWGVLMFILVIAEQTKIEKQGL